MTARDAEGTISDSVIHELGQATNKFETTPEKVIVLAEESCKFPAVEQRPRNTFVKTDMGSVVRALTLLIEELRYAGLLSQERQDNTGSKSSIGLDEVSKTKGLIEAVIFMSQHNDAAVSGDEFDGWLLRTLTLDTPDINFLKADLRKYDLARFGYGSFGESYWKLLSSGLDLARTAIAKGLIDGAVKECLPHEICCCVA